MQLKNHTVSRRGFLSLGLLFGAVGVTLLVTGASASGGTATAAPVGQATGLPRAQLQAIVDRQAAAGVPGLILRVETRDGEVWSGAAGVTSLGGAAMTTGTLFPTFSIAKMATAAAALSMAEDGVISLDDPVSKWVDGPVLSGLPNIDRVYIRHLILQTSGTRDYFDDSFIELLWADPSRNWKPAELVALAKNGAPVGTPNDGDADDSNTNYVLLGLAMEKAAGQPLAAILRSRVFEPLGMTRTASWEEGTLKPEASGYIDAGGELVEVNGLDLSMAWAGGGLVSTAEDVSKLTRGILAGGILNDDSRTLLMTGFNPMKGKKLEYGYGITRDEIAGAVVLGTSGEAAGYASAAYYDPSSGATLVVFTNRFSEGYLDTLEAAMTLLQK